MRIGVLGGTFDPIHYGHLVAAEEVRDRLGMATVLFVPTGIPPHKREVSVSPAEHRVAMVQLAIAGNHAFALSRVDVDRAGPSYTADTLAILQSELGPSAKLHFILGLDSLLEVHTWHEPAKLVELAHLVVVTRPHQTVPDLCSLDGVLPGARDKVVIMPIPQLDISASDLRQRVASGRTIKYQVPEAVEGYIYERGMYRRDTAQVGTPSAR